jgi:hypothetical protein
MRRLLIPDAGPLFSLAAADLLHLLGKFRVGITDVVLDETVNRGLVSGCSIEASRLLAYYNQNCANIQTFKTQVGVSISAVKAVDPLFAPPANLGELSIQSLLIDIQLNAPSANPVILFEDGWFLRNAPALAKPCVLLSTQAFLEYAQEKRWIASAAQARQAIALARPTAYQESVTIQNGGLSR